MLGRLLHYSVDAVLVSTVLAGIKRTSGFQCVLIACLAQKSRGLNDHRVQTSALPDNTIRGIADQYLGVGETVFDMLQATAVNSKYFKRENR